MDLERKFAIVDEEISSGLKLKAADRLQNLINEYPNDLTIWNKLAELYYDSGFLASAGRYWVLFEPTDERMRKCIDVYLNSVNNSGYQILLDIKFRGDLESLPEYAQKKLSEFQVDSFEKINFVPNYTKRISKKNQHLKKSKEKNSFKAQMISILMQLLLILIPILLIIGLISVILWFF